MNTIVAPIFWIVLLVISMIINDAKNRQLNSSSIQMDNIMLVVVKSYKK